MRQTKRTAAITTSSDGRTVQQTYEEDMRTKCDPLQQYDPWAENKGTIQHTAVCRFTAEHKVSADRHKIVFLTTSNWCVSALF